jgi:hypothetical protein
VIVIGRASATWAEPDQTSTPVSNGEQTPQPASRPERDFLFGRPIGWVGLRGSWLIPSAGGDLFAFVSDQLTISGNDFKTAAITAEVGFSISPRLEAAVGVESAHRSIDSEYRRFVDNQGLPITQVTTLRQVDVGGSVRYALVERGRAVSRYAFVPRTITPYVGAGAGFHYYRLTQWGDFVDFATFRVFNDLFTSNGWSPSAHVLGGADIRLWRALFLTVDGRYVWTHGHLGPDFVGFDGIDLNGFRLSSGVSLFFR